MKKLHIPVLYVYVVIGKIAVIQFCSPRKEACFLLWILLSPDETPAEIFVSSCTRSVVSVPIIVIIKKKGGAVVGDSKSRERHISYK